MYKHIVGSFVFSCIIFGKKKSSLDFERGHYNLYEKLRWHFLSKHFKGIKSKMASIIAHVRQKCNIFVRMKNTTTKKLSKYLFLSQD